MPNRLTRSARLRKYESVYNSYLKKVKNKSGLPVNRKNPKKIIPKSNPEKVLKELKKNNKKNLTKYQKFVQKESRKKKYKNLLPRERLTHIAKNWNQKKLSSSFTPP